MVMVQMAYKLHFEKYCITRKDLNYQSLASQQENKAPGEMGSKEVSMKGAVAGGCTSALGKRLDKETSKKASSLNVLFAAFLDLSSTCLRKKKKKQSKCK